MKEFLTKWYPVIIAFACMLYSIGLGLAGMTDEAQYSRGSCTMSNLNLDSYLKS